MKKTFFAFATILLVPAFASEFDDIPSVSDVVVSQDASTRRVTVSYVLSDAPAIVTCTFRTNGIPLPDGQVTALSGDVNRLLDPRSTTYSFTWNPDRDFPVGVGADELVAELTPWRANDPPEYLAVDLTAPCSWRFYVSSNAVPGGVSDRRYKTDTLLMRKIRAMNRSFRMGSPEDEQRRGSDETLHMVTFTNDYYIGVYEVTRRQFDNVISTDPSTFRNADDAAVRAMDGRRYAEIRGAEADPAENSDIYDFRVATGIFSLDLPTEAQWEFACRAGTDTELNSGKGINRKGSWFDKNPDTSSNLNAVAWWGANSSNVTNVQTGAQVKSPREVGCLVPNAFGLYDMHGNVREYCRDWKADYAADAEAISPTGPASGAQRVVRGGHYDSVAEDCRSAARSGVNPNLYSDLRYSGFRLVCLPYFGSN